MKTILASSLLAVSVLAAFLYANEPQQTTVDQVQTVIAAPTAAVDDGSETASALGGNGSAYTYCSATLNSCGIAARINCIGSLGVSQHSFGLRVTGLPVQPQSFGVFTCGGTQMHVPFGDGYLCINPLGGLYRMTPQMLTDTTVSRSVLEAPAEFQLFQPATTWNFQFWYCNPAAGGAGFNLSDGLSVQFGN
jgi:hypothetical protein